MCMIEDVIYYNIKKNIINNYRSIEKRRYNFYISLY